MKNMKVKVLKVSDYNFVEEREINTLQELKAIYKNVIVDFDVDTETYGNYDAIVTIYDGYFE